MLPNYYQNYQSSQPYNYSNYTPYGNYNSVMQQSQPQTMMQPPQVPALNGKIVDSEETARVQEIAPGSYGVYPKADMTSIYIKTWNNDGTTRITTYTPVIDVPLGKKENTSKDLSNFNQKLTDIQSMIEDLNNKFDSISQNSTSDFIPINKRKKVNNDAE